MTCVGLAPVSVPDFGLPREPAPAFPAALRRTRVSRAAEGAREAGFTHLIVYSDREHAANIEWLTGYEPRFEEALAILEADTGRIHLIVGNEGLGYAPICPLSPAVHLYQGFSLLGQARGKAPRLGPALGKAGITSGVRIGLVGWKMFGPAEADDPAHTFDVPHWIVQSLKDASAGAGARLENAAGLFVDPDKGFRIVHELEQLLEHEWHSTRNSQGVRRILESIEPGMTEFDLAERLGYYGQPFSCHMMLCTGERAFWGLASPTSRKIEEGDPMNLAVGVLGTLNCRAGYVARGPGGRVPADYVEKVVSPYMQAVAAWYAAVRVGAPAREVHDRALAPLAGSAVRLLLNPGHFIGYDEWVNSPFYPESSCTLKSGQALQADLIPVAPKGYYGSNAEDSLCLADGALRTRWQKEAPESWARIQARRRFMTETLGYALPEEILPFSNIPGVVRPFMLDRSRAIVMDRP